MVKKYFLLLILVVNMSSYSQEFIPEYVLVRLEYSNHIRDKFLPVWQAVIKKNKITKETYNVFDVTKQSKKMPLPFDSTIFTYDSEGRLISSEHTPSLDDAGNTKRFTTKYKYEFGLLVGSEDSRGNILNIKRDSDGRTLSISYSKGKFTDNYKFHYTNGKLTLVVHSPKDSKVRKILLENGVYQPQNEYITIDKYGRTTYVYYHMVGLSCQYDSCERLTKMQTYQGGTSEVTSFSYKNDLLKEIIHKNYEGKAGADIKYKKMTKSVKITVRYE